MNDASEQGAKEFKSRWVVPTEESRAELAEWGLRTREEQDEFYRAMAESLKNLHRAELEMKRRIERSRRAAEEALKMSAQFRNSDVVDAALVERSREATCKHRERQATIREILRDNGGGMSMSNLMSVLTKSPHNFFRGEAVMALIDSPQGFEVDFFNLTVSICDQ